MKAELTRMCASFRSTQFTSGGNFGVEKNVLASGDVLPHFLPLFFPLLPVLTDTSDPLDRKVRTGCFCFLLTSSRSLVFSPSAPRTK